MGTLEARWVRRALFPGTSSERSGSQAVVDVSGEHVAEIARTPADVWAWLSTPANHGGARDGFVLPGPGPGRWCLMTEVAGGMVGVVNDVLEREDGRRIVLRFVGSETIWVWSWGVFDAGATPAAPTSLVRLTITAAVRARVAAGAERGLQTAARRALARMDQVLTGAPPPLPLKELDTRATERAQRHASMEPPTRGEVDVHVVIPVPVDEVWRGVLDASTFTLDAAPEERPGVVPGTPIGQVGELRYVITSPGSDRFVRFHEVVGVGPGRRLVLRHQSSGHPTQSVTTVVAHPDGALVRIVCEVALHGDHARMIDATRAAFCAHLVRLREELVRRAAADPGPLPTEA
ncbi:MAG: SRPBCC family protein [Cellulomonas sp.]